MRKKRVIISVFILLFGITNAWAGIFDDVLLFNDTRGNDWFLSGDVAKYDGSLSGQTVTVDLLGNATILTIFGMEGYKGVPASPDPSAANGEIITFTYGNNIFSGRIASINSPEGYNGIIRIPDTYNLRFITEGTQPIIAWSNNFNIDYPNYTLDQYLVRVFDENWNMLVNHAIRSSSTDQSFDFNTIDFAFEEGNRYTIRVEARKYTDLYDENNQVIGANEFAEYALVINRNKADLNYQLLNGQNIATIFNEIGLFSDNTSDGWELNVGPFFSTSPSSNPTVTINDSGTAIANAEIPFYSWGSYWGLISTDPEEANGKSMVWSADGQTATADLPVNSIFQIPVSTNLQLTGGTEENPILSWENNSSGIDHFRVRVYETGGVAFLVDEQLYDIAPGVTYSFDFSSIAFIFDTEKSYTVRVEACAATIGMENSTGVPLAYILNRSKAEMLYGNTNGGNEEPLLTTYYYDYDGDGYGDPSTAYELAQPLTGYVTDNTDCNDYDSSIHPGATEIGGDGIDQDCNGSDVSTQQLVTEIYVATFERAPAYAGLMYWTNAVEAGDFSIEQVAQSFFDQEETQAKFPEGTSNTQFIETVFYNTLSRAPVAAGLAYWVDALDRGLFTRDQAIMSIINGAKAVTGSPVDAAMLAKKTEIGLMFANSEIGDSNTHVNFMDWAKNVISFATSSDFNIEEAEEYILELLNEAI